MKKQTAVERLVDYIKNLEKYPYKTIQELEDQAKAMEREQIEKAYLQGDEDGFHSTESQSDYEIEGRSKYVSEQYYNQTFGGEE